jgi:hypothetical protein
MKQIIFIIIFSCSFKIYAQTDFFRWSDETCEYLGKFETAKINKESLEDTYQLWFLNYGGFETQVHANIPTDIDKLSYKKIEIEYLERLNSLKSLKLLPDTYWDSLRLSYIDELNSVYYLKKITIQAYKYPKTLYAFIDANSKAKYYARILNGSNQEIMEGWDNLIEEQCKTNGYPEKLREEHFKKKKSRDSLLYAKIELMTYGWWNSANEDVKRVDQNRRKTEKIFKTYFIKIDTVNCDEP